MPRFDMVLGRQAKSALDLVKAGEQAHTSSSISIRRAWNTPRLEALYELAYLRIFAAWEMCQEDVFYRSLCGYASKLGQEVLHRGSYFPNLAAAESDVLGRHDYKLWHNARQVITRCQRYFVSGGPGFPCTQETMLTSNFSRLVNFERIRHRIVHDNMHAKKNFDLTTIQISARTYPGSRPGKLLRDWDVSSIPHKRWLDVMVMDLVSLAAQIV
jgi:hypothetical protein